MIVKLLTEHHLEFLSLKGGCRGLSQSTLAKMSNCLTSHAAAQMENYPACTELMSFYQVDGYSCDCAAGYTGAICETDINECEPNPCIHSRPNGCSNLVANFSCSCLPGYTG